MTKIIMMGTGPFAVPTLRRLLDSKHEVLALVTRPARGTKSRGNLSVNPMRVQGEAAGLPVIDPEDVNAQEVCQKLLYLAAELLVVCDYGQILSNETLATTSYGGINLHGSLLPKYRSAAPVNYAIWQGDNETGVSVIHMTPGLDSGPVLTAASTPIGPDETAVELEERLSELGVEPVIRAIDMLAAWDGVSPLGQPQDKTLVSKAPRLKKAQGEIDWSDEAVRIYNQFRALQPWPGAYTFLTKGKRQPVRLILDQIRIVQDQPASGAAGTVAEVSKDRLWINTSAGLISLESLQPAGKRAMSVVEFLRGYSLEVGDELGAGTAEN